METNLTYPAIVLNKLLNTIAVYRSRYPELGYLQTGVVLQQDNLNQEEELLHRANTYIKENLFAYYIFRIIHFKLQQDLQALQQNQARILPDELYLEFGGSKEMVPIK